MSRLVKGLYGHEFRSESRLFGLICGQMRVMELVHNGGWYNQHGEKLGWGDLSKDDLNRIKAELEPGEIFVVLPEHASFWNFVTHPGMIGSMSVVKPDEQAPGVDYIREHCSWIITPGKIYEVNRRFNPSLDHAGIPTIGRHWRHEDLIITNIGRNHVSEIF